MLKDAEGKGLEVERRQRRIQGTDEILVEPLCFFDLEADSLNGLEFFAGEIDNEADA